MYSSTDRDKKYNILCTTLIIVYPIFNAYASLIPGVTLSEFVLFPLIIISTFQMCIKNRRFPTKYIPYSILILIISVSSLIPLGIQSYANTLDILKGLTRIIYYFLLISVVGCQNFNYDLGIKIYKFITVLAVIYITLQIVMYYAFGYILLNYLPFIDLMAEGYAHIYDSFVLFRPASFFAEPSYFAQYCLIGMIMSLFTTSKEFKGRKNLFAIITTYGLIVSTSGIAIIMGCFVWIIWMLKKIQIFNMWRSIIRFGFVIMITLILVKFLFSFDYFISTIDRISRYFYGGGRLLRGVYIYNELESLFKILGIGIGNVSAYVLFYNITTPFDEPPNFEYMNSASYILVTSGIFGFAAYSNMIWNLIANTKDSFRMLVISLFLISCGEYAFSNSIWLLYLTFAFKGYKGYASIASRRPASCCQQNFLK